MEDDDVEDIPASSTRPFFVSGGFPFVFLPTTYTTGFSSGNNHTRVSANDDQTKTESKMKKVNDENSEEIRIEEAEERAENDEVNRNNENEKNSDEKTDLRISQPKYSQLLRELDFSETKMVDVTNLLTDELEQQINDSRQNEVENPEEHSSNENQLSSSSTSSSVSSDEVLNNRKLNTNKNNEEKDDRRKKEPENLLKAAADDVQQDLNNLASRIQVASQMSDDKFEEETTNHLQKRHTFDEDDDTSKQATQNYDLNDNEQEEILQSTKSGRNSRFSNQQNPYSILNENKSSNLYIDTNRNINRTNQNQSTEQQEQQQELFNDWAELVVDPERPPPPLSEQRSSQIIIENRLKPKNSPEQKPRISFNDEREIIMDEVPQPRTRNRHNPETSSSSSSSSSSDTGSVVQYDLSRPKHNQSSPQVQHTTPQRHPLQTLRQDSQATLIDENLDDLSSQMKQVLDQERQTLNTSTKEERTTDGIGSISMRLTTPDMLSTNFLDHDSVNRVPDNSLRHPSTQRRHRHSIDVDERPSPQKKRAHHHQHHNRHQRHTIPSSHMEHKEENDPKRTDEDWLNVLERLEHEHRLRLEKQQQQYENQMHTLEEKMKRRFDDYITLTNGFQESRLEDYDDAVRVYPTPSSVPIDSNIGRHKEHSHGHQHRSSAKDLVSHYYPADSTLNILSSEKRRPTGTTYGVRSRSRDDTLNLRTELSAIHAKHIADLKLYYEYEITELKNQLNRARMGQSSSNSRPSMETIGRITSENVRLQDDVNELRHSLKTTEEENMLLKRQLDELREQLNNRDLDLKNYHRTIVDLEKQLTEAENTKERQDERYRHADRQALLYREENEKIKTDLNLARERLLRLEERYNQQENENEVLRRQLFIFDNDSNRINQRLDDDHKLTSTMALNQTTSAEYGRFALNTTRHTSPKPHVSRETNINSRRFNPTEIESSMRHANSPRPMTRISDYLNEKPVFPSPYVPPTKRSYSPRKPSPNRRRVEPATNRTSTDKPLRQSEHLEQKFDQLLRKKRDLETRLNRIPLRGLTNIDKQLCDVLEREIERVEQQIASVKLELRKLNVLRAH